MKNLQKLQDLRSIALDNLRKLAKANVELTHDEEDNTPFEQLDISEQKRIVKKKISNQIDMKIKEYLNATNFFELSNVYEDFIMWLNKQ